MAVAETVRDRARTNPRVVTLVLYLWKVSGGYTKEFFVPAGAPLAGFAGVIETAYLVMLAIHILLSAISVPVVLHAVVLGLTHAPAELRDTVHARVGRVAAVAWSVSLALGVVTYLLLLVYDSRPLNEGSLLVLLAAPAARFRQFRDGSRARSLPNDSGER